MEETSKCSLVQPAEPRRGTDWSSNTPTLLMRLLRPAQLPMNMLLARASHVTSNSNARQRHSFFLEANFIIDNAILIFLMVARQATPLHVIAVSLQYILFEIH